MAWLHTLERQRWKFGSFWTVNKNDKVVQFPHVGEVPWNDNMTYWYRSTPHVLTAVCYTFNAFIVICRVRFIYLTGLLLSHLALANKLQPHIDLRNGWIPVLKSYLKYEIQGYNIGCERSQSFSATSPATRFQLAIANNYCSRLIQYITILFL